MAKKKVEKKKRVVHRVKVKITGREAEHEAERWFQWAWWWGAKWLRFPRTR
jgi:hypothetical protein